MEVGARAVAGAREYFEALGFETVEGPGGFSWRLNLVEQSVWCSSADDLDGTSKARVHISTPLVTGVRDVSRTIDLLATVVSAQTLVGAPVVGEDGSIAVVSSVLVDPLDPAWAQSVVPHVARMQIASAETMVEPILSVSGGSRAVLKSTASMTPTLSPTHRDPVRALRALPMSLGPRWEATMLAAAAALWNEALGGTVAFVEDEALTTGVPWRPTGNATDPWDVAMIQGRLDVPHLYAGRGLFMLLDVDEELPNLEIMRLNQREVSAGIDADLVGSWCRSPVTSDVAFVAFLPEDLACEQTLLRMMTSYVRRAEWLRMQLFEGRYD